MKNTIAEMNPILKIANEIEKQTEDEIKKCLEQRYDIETKIKNLEQGNAEKIFGNFTIYQIGKIWNESDPDSEITRSELMRLNPAVQERLEHFADFGGLTEPELGQIALEEFFETASYVNIRECFENICKELIDEKDCKHDQGIYKNEEDEKYCVLCGMETS